MSEQRDLSSGTPERELPLPEEWQPDPLGAAATDSGSSEKLWRQLAFLARASQVLVSSLDYQQTLSTVAQLIVPHFADWCTVDMIEEDGLMRQLVVAHADPSKVKWARELQKQYPPQPEAPRGMYNVLRTKQSELYPQITDDILRETVQDEEQLRLLQAVGMRSVMIVPLQARGVVLGTLSFVSTNPERAYKESDLVWAEELARIAALAADNARLYSDAQQAKAELETIVATRTAELEEINRELEAFSYSVSHDLRAPLRSIDGFSQALLEEYEDQLDETGRDYLRRVRAAAQRMATLIDDLLSLSRITRSELSWQPVDLTQLARSIVEHLRTTAPQRQVEVIIQEGMSTKGDPRFLSIALENLLGNAWKFSSTRKEARIEMGVLEQDEKEQIFFVRDNGVGFKMDYAHKLFNPFQRLHSTQEFEGTGIGLALLKRVIHRHGGHVWAESKVDQGATFYFSLPQKDS